MAKYAVGLRGGHFLIAHDDDTFDFGAPEAPAFASSEALGAGQGLSNASALSAIASVLSAIDVHHAEADVPVVVAGAAGGPVDGAAQAVAFVPLEHVALDVEGGGNSSTGPTVAVMCPDSGSGLGRVSVAATIDVSMLASQNPGMSGVAPVYHAADEGFAAAGQSASGTAPAASMGTIAQLADYLNTGYWAWSGYGGTGARHWTAGSTVTVNITGLTAAEQNLATSALNAWHEVCNLNFSYTSGPAQITYNHNGSGVAATSMTVSGSNLISATIDISSDWWPNTNIYSYMYQTYLHETGHALGLGHQGPYNGSATYGVNNVFTNDTWQYSVMSYFSQNNFGGTYDYVITPETADITAVQSTYGATTTRVGDTVYGFNSTAGSIYNFSLYSGTPAFTIYDSGGTDTLDCSGYSSNQTINLTGGSWCSVGGYVNNIGIFTTSQIEYAVGGSGNDTINGNDLDNTLRGGLGNDTINGGAGTDSAVFSGLRSAYTLTDLGGGSVRVAGPDGTDTLSGIERLVFSDQTINWSFVQITALNEDPYPGQQFVANSMFTVTSSNAITNYEFWDATTDVNSGHFLLNGIEQPGQVTLSVSASNIGQVNFQMGAGGADYAYVRAYDGTNWSSWTPLDVDVPPHTPPHVTALDEQPYSGQQFVASSMFTVTTTSPITSYQFWDATTDTNSGHFLLNGIEQAAQQTLTVSSANIGRMNFQMGHGGADYAYVRVFDGTAWSSWTPLDVDVPAPAPPQVVALNENPYPGQQFVATSMFTVNAASPITSYQFWDATTDANSGHFLFNGIEQSAQQTLTYSASNVGQLNFQMGHGGPDYVYVRVFDGTNWSAWTTLDTDVPATAAPPAQISVADIVGHPLGDFSAGLAAVQPSFALTHPHDLFA